MSKINISSRDLEPHFLKNRNTVDTDLKRHCGNCKKDFSYEEVMKTYPELIQDSITMLWKNSEINFYCSYCHLLKLVKKINNNKKNH